MVDTDRGNKGYGSSGISSTDNEKLSKSKDDAVAKMNQDFKTNAVNKSEAKANQLAQARRIISVRQIQRLAKEDHPIFLAIVRANENPQERMTRKGKRMHHRAARLAVAQGLTKRPKTNDEQRNWPYQKYYFGLGTRTPSSRGSSCRSSVKCGKTHSGVPSPLSGETAKGRTSKTGGTTSY